MADGAVFLNHVEGKSENLAVVKFNPKTADEKPSDNQHLLSKLAP